jgi:hypothetical protein
VGKYLGMLKAQQLTRTDKENKLAIGNSRNRLKSRGSKNQKPSGTSASH